MTLLKRLFIVVALIAVVVVIWAVVSVNADTPVTYDDIAEHFKYGSIGAEPGGSLLQPIGGVLPPYAVLTALPALCPEKLPPDGLAGLGFIIEQGHDLPIGVSRRHRIGIDHVEIGRAHV